ncbi:uncharacterized protein LOC134841720 [Symsagittifera roscoffensis]|uniref:uncharacterized protein LOC134841720 n=1 Tax=Symsagittifera roscoffensis TaxID=84072 RepID=UPI00307B2844
MENERSNASFCSNNPVASHDGQPVDEENEGKGEGFFTAEDVISHWQQSGHSRSNSHRSDKSQHLKKSDKRSDFQGDWDDADSLSDDSSERSSVGGGMSKFLEKQFFQLVEDNDCVAVEEMLWKHKHEVQMGGRNKEGFTALGLAAICGSKEMMETLLHSGCDMKEEPLICIQQDFQPGLMILLDKLAQQGVDGANMSLMAKSGATFPRGANCVMEASVNNNINMLKVLSLYGSKPLPPPTVRVPSMFDVMLKSLRSMEDRSNVLEHAEGMLYTLKALSSPAYAMIMESDDPLMASFQMAQRLKYLASKMPMLKDELLKLAEQQEGFAAEWLGSAGDNYEVNIVLALEEKKKSQARSSREDSDRVVDPYARLSYALRNNHQKVTEHTLKLGLKK